MRDEAKWKPSRFVFEGDCWRASRDPAAVNPASRLICDLQARAYYELISTFSHGALLDAGCGEAPLYGMYRKHVDWVVCTDWPETQHQISHADFSCDLSRPLPIASNSFDTILCTDVIEHLYDPFYIWQECYRILRPGGVLLLATPFLYWIHEPPHDYYRFTQFSIRKLSEGAGLEVHRLNAYGTWKHVILDLVLKRFRSNSVFFPLLERVCQLLSNSRENLRVPTGRFPLGFTLVAKKPLESDTH